MKKFSLTRMGVWVLCAAGLLLGSVSVAADIGALAKVKQVSTGLFSKLADQRAAIERNPAMIHDLVDEILIPHFDFEKITQAAVGPHWKQASAEQRRKLIKGFQDLLIETYAKALLDYSGEEIKYLSEKAGARASTAVVSTEVSEPGTDPVRIDYKLYKKDGDWKVYDVRIDNISMVLNYRSSFEDRIREAGIDGLIASIDEKASQGTNGK